MTNKSLKNLILSAMFLALGFILPMLTGQIPVIGKILLPMHIPVFLCGLICGWKHGLAIGGTLSILRSLLFSVPVMYPTAIAVAFEMAVYGSVTGILYSRSKAQTVRALYCAMLVAMVLGRAVRCVAEIALLGFAGNAFVWKTFVTGVLLNAIPGILLQLILIPAIMLALKRTAPSPRTKRQRSA